jgi:hypothetical protein
MLRRHAASPHLVAGSMRHRCSRPISHTIQIGEAGHLFDGRMRDCSGECIAAVAPVLNCSGDALAPDFRHIGLPPVQAFSSALSWSAAQQAPSTARSRGPPPPHFVRGRTNDGVLATGCVRGLLTTTHRKRIRSRDTKRERSAERRIQPDAAQRQPHVAMKRHLGRGARTFGARSPSGALLRLSPGL